MESTLLYLVAFCIFCGLSFVLWTTKFIFPNVKNFFSRWLKYPLLIQRGRYWDSVTYLQASILAVFFILNLLIIFWPLVEAVDWRVVEKRCAFAAAVNIVPLCIGGRMGLLVRTFNIHRSTYQLFHHWTGRIAVFEGLAHAILVLCHRPKPGQLVLSGWIILGTSLGCLLLSLCLVRVWLGRWFLLSHRVFALATVGGLIWHVLKLSRKAPRVVACLAACLWIFTTCQRLYMIFSYRQSAEVVQKVNGLGATKLELSVKRPVRVPAGSYFNVFFPSQHGSYNILHSYPVMAMWHPPDEHSPSQRLSHISLLMTQRGSYAAALANLQQGQRILLDGPYGQNLRPKLYENVILAVKGMGIAGVLPLALEFAERRQHDNGTKSKLQALWRRLEELSAQIEASRGDKRDAIVQQREKISKEREALARKPLFRDATKRIDLFWSLESDSEPDLVAEELRDLQKLDPGNNMFVVWLGYPGPMVGHPPFELKSTYWMCLESTPGRPFEKLVITKIKEERRRLQGRLLVIACGSPGFTRKVRRGADCSDGLPIDFAEMEYRPPSVSDAPDHILSRGGNSTMRRLRRSTSEGMELKKLTSRSSVGSDYSIASHITHF